MSASPAGTVASPPAISETDARSVSSYARDGNVGVVTIDSPPVNALSGKVRAGIKLQMDAAIADTAAEAIVLICGGRTFIAGADITEFGMKVRPGPSLDTINALLEDSPKPVIAAIHGTALGGGFEVALACHYRVAVPSAKVGLPEVKLGIIPGAGGTQRLPRIVGAARALEMIAFGEHVPVKKALESGAIDEIVEEGKLREGAIAFARRVVAEGRPLKKVRDMDGAAKDRGKPEIFAAFRKANARRFRGLDAPEACIQAVEAAVNLPFDDGIQKEREIFTPLLGGTQSKAQRYVFFAEREVRKVPELGGKPETKPVTSVGILGAGTMGGGIAMNFLNAGIPVTVVETNAEALERGLKTIRKNYEATAAKGRLTTDDVERRMGLLTGSLDYGSLSSQDLVIEAVYENMEIKKQVFAKLDGIAKPGAILASNTSYLNVDEIASATKRPESVIGMHFFSPANVMRLLEVVRAEKADKAVVATAMALAPKIGKVGVLVGVCHGFVGNRMLSERQREANRLVEEGAMPWDVDRVLYDFGLPMGPFAMSDLAGLDIGWSRETSKGETLREKLCEMDRRGQKTGAGFYDYDAARKASPSPVVERMVLDHSKAKGITRRQISDDEILERLVFPMINEGAKILEEGKALRASDIDMVWVTGYGWPVGRGGPMFYADTIGTKRVLDRMEEWSRTIGPEFTPAKLLRDKAAKGETFTGAA